MIFAETSFIVAAYREQENSRHADVWLDVLPEGNALSPLVVFEFENTLQLQVGLFRTDRTRGFPKQIAEQALGDFRSDLEAGFWRIAPIDLPLVLAEAGKLSRSHAADGLCRAMDILHVATAVQWGAKEFLTFDARQARLAKAARLKTPLKAR